MLLLIRYENDVDSKPEKTWAKVEATTEKQHSRFLNSKTHSLHWKKFWELPCHTDVPSIRRSVRGLERNTEVISKQAAKSSDECRDIALFDRSTMFVYDFNSAKTRKGIPKGIFFQGGRDGNICREMLLGFLIRAVAKYDQHNGGLNQHHRHNPNNPEWPPLATNERRLSIYQQTLTPPKHAITKLACQLCGERLKMPLVCGYLFALTLLN